MDDLTLVGVLHGLEHLQEQAQARTDVEPLRIAPVGEQLTLHVLHRQEGQAVGIDAGVVQPRNMRMLQTRENVALAEEALFQIVAHARHRRQLQGHLAVERAVRALRQPHFGHAAGTQQTYQFVRSDAVAGLKSGGLDAAGCRVG